MRNSVFRKLFLALSIIITGASTSVNAAWAEETALVKDEIKTLKLSPTQSNALKLLRTDQTQEAQKLLEDYFKANKTSQDFELLYLLSALQCKNEDFQSAEANLQIVLKNTQDLRQRVFVIKRIGDCHYEMRNFENALKFYDAAVDASSKLEKDDPLRLKLYESKVGVELVLKQYAKAEADAKTLVEIASTRAAKGGISDKVSVLWAYLQLGTIYRNEHKEAERATQQAKVREIMLSLMEARAKVTETTGDDTSSLKEIEKIFLGEYVAQNKPQTLAEYFWLASEFKPLSLPLIGWQVKEGEPKAVLLCIHGLGLNNTSFGTFGKEMSKRGFSVFAIDVRGFGSWQSIQGEETVGFNAAITDLSAVIDHLKVLNPNKPIFLLGESMGGGIALRAAAEFGDTINGVIASVPSAERFQAKRFGFTVAAHFLDGPSRPFNIGDTVAERATTNEEVLKDWTMSSKAKMKMSPKELIKFAVFMRTTVRHCEQIKNTPALLVQGLKDRLVKPEGTYKMFDSISSIDKTMLIDGTAEHLIFESNTQSNLTLDTLCSWLEKHVK